MPQEYYSNGKLLLSGEYAILDGAKGLALPTKFGQYLEIKQNQKDIISWKSLAKDGTTWFTADFHGKNLTVAACSDKDIANTLQQILVEAKKLNPDFLNIASGLEIKTQLTFPRTWGLGTSSTLINNIAQWAEVDGHQLLWNSFGGSGYDISCAQHNTPLIYHIKNKKPIATPVDFKPSFKDAIFFVYLNEKQSSKKAIANYRNKTYNGDALISKIDEITEAMVTATTLEQFEVLLDTHENLVSKLLESTPVKQRLFKDYFGHVKSLGAWGGDFVLATGNEKTPEYFKSKSFNTVLRFSEIVL